MKNKSSIILFTVLAVIFGGFIAWAIVHKQSTPSASESYDVNTIISANEDNGNIGDHIEGNPNAEIIIFEYSDYQCSGCASKVEDVTELVEKSNGRIAVVHRTYVLSYHSNGIAAASAAEAAGLQGYWKEYGDYLFENQSEWYYSDSNERTQLFQKYFITVTDGKGNVDKFLEDMGSEAVNKKVSFDIALAKKADAASSIEYTPAFFYNGKFIDWAYDNEDDLSFIDYISKLIGE